ncbi:MAG: DUF4352 domain-containing protein [Methanothermobacter sp.]|nr:DUF4352 domain-containing protein [Methanothermobacter sp.]
MIVVLAIYAIGCLLIDADVAVTVNSAYTVDSIIDNSPSHDRFIIMNVTVENKGDGPVTVSALDFNLLSDGEYMSYSNFYGNDTDVPESVRIPPGESRSFLLVFDVEDKPEILEYNSLWDPLSDPETSRVGPVNIIPNPNSYANYETSGQINNKSYHQTVNVTYRNATNGQIEEIINMSGETVWLTESVYQEPIPSQSRVFDPETLEDDTGTYSSMIFLPKGYGEGDSIPVRGSEGETGAETIVGSAPINVMDKIVNCWETITIIEEGGVKIQVRRYYDKTTGLLLKKVWEEEGSAYGVSYTSPSTMQLTSTNIPLISDRSMLV